MTDQVPPTDVNQDDNCWDEQFPLSPLDDFMIHQTPDPIRVMWTGDPRAYERYWMMCWDPTGQTFVATGGSFYPNLDRAEAFAIVNHRGRHTSVRSFRRLGFDRSDLRVGPIAPTVVRGLREWQHRLLPNEWGISFDLTFEDTTRQVFREPLSDSAHGTPPGRRNDVTSGFESLGQVHGWVDIDGTRIELPAGSAGTRDRHWGTGRGVGGPSLSLGGRLHVGVSGNAFVPFDGWSLWGDRIYLPFGHQTPSAVRVGKPVRRLSFEPDTQLFNGGTVDYPVATGATKQLRYERIGQQTIFLRCGMYGGTPTSGIHQGTYDGPDLTEGETYDLIDPEVRLALRGLDEHLCRVQTDEGEASIGVYQTIDPTAHDNCTAGRPGWSLQD